MSARAEAIIALQQSLDYAFQDAALLEEALSHASLGQGARKTVHNERLEFLGDRVLNLLVAETLMRRYPEAREGDLSKRLHVLVNRESCASIAREIGVGPALRLPGGETKRGARDQETILADAMEALLAAIFVEAGLEGARQVFDRLWATSFADIDRLGFANPKSELQEWAAQEKIAPPKYTVAARIGPDHAPVFTVRLEVEGRAPLEATGRSRQDAEKAAARLMLAREGSV